MSTFLFTEYFVKFLSSLTFPLARDHFLMATTTYKEEKKEGMLGEAKNHNSLIDRIRACDELFLDEKTGGVNSAPFSDGTIKMLTVLFHCPR